MTKSRGLMLGRFQPFHNGHVALARQILGECDELIVVIGSAQFNFIEKDPFTAGERISMIHGALTEAGLDMAKCFLVPLANDDNNARWLAYLKSTVPPFDILYTGNDFVRHIALSQDPGIVIRQPKFARKQEYNATNIRRLIVGRKRWKHLVPAAVAREIERVGGTERIRLLASTGSDSNPQKW